MRSLADSSPGFLGITAFLLEKGELSAWEERRVTRAADIGRVSGHQCTRHRRESSSSHSSGDSIPVYMVYSEPFGRDFLDVQSLSGPAFGAQPASPAPAVVPSSVALF